MRVPALHFDSLKFLNHRSKGKVAGDGPFSTVAVVGSATTDIERPYSSS